MKAKNIIDEDGRIVASRRVGSLDLTPKLKRIGFFNIVSTPWSTPGYYLANVTKYSKRKVFDGDITL